MSDEDIYLGEKIRQFRIIKHFSQEELGKALNLNKQAVSRIEKGIRRVSHIELMKIADLLEQPIEAFVEREIKFKLIQTKWSIVAIPKFAVDFLEDYKTFLDNKELNADSVKLIYDEIVTRMRVIFVKRFRAWAKIFKKKDQ